MSCCFPQGFPKEFKDLPDFSINGENQEKVEDLTQQIAEKRTYYSGLPPIYKGRCPVRVIVIAITVIAIAVSIMALNGTLTTFPQHFMRFIQTINWSYVSIGVGVFTVLTVGAAIVIHKAIHKQDRLTHTSVGKLRGDDHWVSAVYIRDDFEDSYFPGYIDTSTLNEEKTGVAFMYAHKDEQNHHSVSIAVTVFTPLHLIGVIAYNAIRLVLIPFFILGCMLVEKASHTAIDPTDRPYRLSDIPEEMTKSLWRIAKAPFYALATMFASLFSFFDPLNGRKLGAIIEREWNEGVTRAEGFWSVRGPQPLWQFEGGRNPSNLGKNGFYVAGCWQPIAVVHYKDGKIVEGASLSRAIIPEKGKPYTILTHSILLEQNNTLVDQLEKLRP